MDGIQRRKDIIALLKQSKQPLSGTALAKQLGVSRQIVVQDIALLRATNKNILSTNKGYVLFDDIKKKEAYRKSLAVKHTDEQMRDELYTIVDCNARVIDVVVEHDVYGQISADLVISSRRDVDDFLYKIQREMTKPLKELTGDIHYHTVEADSQEALDLVERRLKEKGYLIL